MLIGLARTRQGACCLRGQRGGRDRFVSLPRISLLAAAPRARRTSHSRCLSPLNPRAASWCTRHTPCGPDGTPHSRCSMSGRRILTTFALLVVTSGAVDSVYAQAPSAYRVEDLGSLGGRYLIALAINNNGDVAGYGDLANGTIHAFRWTRSGGLEDLGANGGVMSQAY